MAIDAKQSFLSQVEHKCADLLTVTNMSKVLGTISDLLQHFRMEELRMETDSQEDDLLDSFVASLRVQGRSQKTINRYTYIIGRFMKFANVKTRQVNVYHVRNWIAAEKDRGIQDSTLEGNRQVLSSYFGWLFRESLIEKNPVVNVGVIKVPKKRKRIYSEAVEPIKPLDKDDDYTFLCSNCKGELFCGDVLRDNYCPTCGRSVKWE